MSSFNNPQSLLETEGLGSLAWNNNLDELVFGSTVVFVTALAVTLLRETWFTVKNTFGSTILTKFVYELLATLELTVTQFELHLIVYPNYSFTVYFVGQFVYASWVNFREQQVRSCQTTTANPVQVLRSYLAGEVEGQIALARVAGQVSGALLAYPLVILPAWSVGSKLFFSHDLNLHNMETTAHYWPTGAIVSSPTTSALVEGSVTFFTCILPSLLRSSSALNPTIETHAFIFISTLTAALTTFSGALFNPAVASSLEFSTVGLCPEAKVFVYWIAPCLGMVAAFLCERKLAP